MNAAQTKRFYDFFKQQLKVADESKVKIFVEKIEKIVENKFDAEKSNFLQKPEYEKIEYKIDLLKQQIENSSLRVENNLKSEINKLIICIIGIIFTSAMLFFAFSKFIH